MDGPTIEVYEQRAADWGERRGTPSDQGRHLAGWVASGTTAGPVVDLGCGPGLLTADLGGAALALDAAAAMLHLTAARVPGTPLVRASIDALPFAPRSLGAALASKVYVHLPRSAVPRSLAQLHRCLRVDGRLGLHVFDGDTEFGPLGDDDFPGRQFSRWPERLLLDVLEGAGFGVEWHEAPAPDGSMGGHRLGLRRLRTLPDTVGPDMRVLVCGLNPSLHAADAGVGFHTANNRFWAAAREADLVTVERDPHGALDIDRVGMTDLVKRATPRASELTVAEYRAGLARLERLCSWLRPGAVCFVGLAGWRAAVDRRAVAGVAASRLGGSPVYVMPSTSGLNAATGLDELTAHLRAASTLADA